MLGEQIQAWQIFYSTVALASAGLMGLIFLSLSIRLDVIRKSKDENLRHVAWQTFLNFFFLIMFALVFLVPEQSGWTFALPLIVISGVAIAVTTARGVRSGKAGTRVWIVFREAAPSFVAYLGVIIVALLALKGYARSLVWMLPVVVVLLAVAIRNAWELLVAVYK